MNNQLTKKTNKLFYGEYPYKIVTVVKHAARLRNWKLPELIAWCQDPTSNVQTYIGSYYGWSKPKQVTVEEKADLLKYCMILSRYPLKDLKTRIESGALTLFVKDKLTYTSMLHDLRDYVIEQWEPENELVLAALIDNKKTVLCNEYPHGKYRYKVTLKPAKGQAGVNFLEWIDNYSAEKVYMPKGSRKYLEENHPYYDPYLYVTDEKMLMLINFASSGNVRRCEEFILRSSINTSS